MLISSNNMFDVCGFFFFNVLLLLNFFFLSLLFKNWWDVLLNLYIVVEVFCFNIKFRDFKWKIYGFYLD